jgi:hypothetical protein
MEKDTYNVMVTSKTGVVEYPEDYQDYIGLDIDQMHTFLNLLLTKTNQLDIEVSITINNQ